MLFVSFSLVLFHVDLGTGEEQQNKHIIDSLQKSISSIRRSHINGLHFYK
jgi:hypothetical protein